MNRDHLSSKLPTLQIAWDATSLTAALNCPRKYYYAILKGYTSRSLKVDLEFGIHYHKALETFDKLRDHDFDHAQQAAADYALLCGFDSDDRNKNRFNLVRAVVWYTEKWKEDPFRVVYLGDKPAVELSFAMELPVLQPDGTPYLLCGHLDGLMTSNGEDVFVRERKTTKTTLGDNYWQQFSPNTQVSVYSLAGKIALHTPVRGVIIDACQSAVTFSEFGRHEAWRHSAHLDEFMGEVCHWIKRMERYALEDFWPKNESSCFLCQFKRICSKHPDNREEWLDAEFVKNPWAPLEIR